MEQHSKPFFILWSEAKVIPFAHTSTMAVVCHERFGWAFLVFQKGSKNKCPSLDKYPISLTKNKEELQKMEKLYLTPHVCSYLLTSVFNLKEMMIPAALYAV
jgi:hypothetical protein